MFWCQGSWTGPNGVVAPPWLGNVCMHKALQLSISTNTAWHTGVGMLFQRWQWSTAHDFALHLTLVSWQVLLTLLIKTYRHLARHWTLLSAAKWQTYCSRAEAKAALLACWEANCLHCNTYQPAFPFQRSAIAELDAICIELYPQALTHTLHCTLRRHPRAPAHTPYLAITLQSFFKTKHVRMVHITELVVKCEHLPSLSNAIHEQFM